MKTARGATEPRGKGRHPDAVESQNSIMRQGVYSRVCVFCIQENTWRSPEPPKWKNMMQEIKHKVLLYNKWRDETIFKSSLIPGSWGPEFSRTREMNYARVLAGTSFYRPKVVRYQCPSMAVRCKIWIYLLDTQLVK